MSTVTKDVKNKLEKKKNRSHMGVWMFLAKIIVMHWICPLVCLLKYNVTQSVFNT